MLCACGIRLYAYLEFSLNAFRGRTIDIVCDASDPLMLECLLFVSIARTLYRLKHLYQDVNSCSTLCFSVDHEQHALAQPHTVMQS